MTLLNAVNLFVQNDIQSSRGAIHPRVDLRVKIGVNVHISRTLTELVNQNLLAHIMH